MPRYIDADKIPDFVCSVCGDICDDEFKTRGCIERQFIEECAKKMPTVDAEPVRHGHWTNIKISVTGNSSAECSQCGTVVHDTFADVDRLNYCPHCGAKMGEVEERCQY